MEGLAGTACGDDAGDDAIAIGQDVARGNTQRRKTEAIDNCVATAVAIRPIAAPMYLAIDFNREAGFEAGKVERKFAERMLAAEAEAAGVCSKRAPEDDFGQIAAAPFAAGKLDCPPRCAERRATHPSTSLRLVPLPVPGRYSRIAPHHIRNTPKLWRSGIGALSVAASARPSTSRVCAGSMMPSSHSRAVACQGEPCAS